jgi:hypothetical protein
MAKAFSSDWTVRFPLNLYTQFSDKIKSEYLEDVIHPSILGQRFEDVSFVIKDGYDKADTIEKLRYVLDSIADEKSLEILHAPQGLMSSFEVQYSINGKPEIRFD